MKPAFWMICRSPRHAGAKTEPKARYSSADDARRAAQELADQCGEPFVILAVTETVWPHNQTRSLF